MKNNILTLLAVGLLVGMTAAQADPITRSYSFDLGAVGGSGAFTVTAENDGSVGTVDQSHVTAFSWFIPNIGTLGLGNLISLGANVWGADGLVYPLNEWAFTAGITEGFYTPEGGSCSYCTAEGGPVGGGFEFNVVTLIGGTRVPDVNGAGPYLLVPTIDPDPSAVPEPETLALLVIGLGLAGMKLSGRRKN